MAAFASLTAIVPATKWVPLISMQPFTLHCAKHQRNNRRKCRHSVSMDQKHFIYRQNDSIPLWIVLLSVSTKGYPQKFKILEGSLTLNIMMSFNGILMVAVLKGIGCRQGYSLNKPFNIYLWGAPQSVIDLIRTLIHTVFPAPDGPSVIRPWRTRCVSNSYNVKANDITAVKRLHFECAHMRPTN